MSRAIRILAHAIWMVCRDPSGALYAIREGLSLILMSSALLLVIAPEFLTGPQNSDTSGIIDHEGNAVAVALAFFAHAAGYIMMMAAWHRYILLQGHHHTEGCKPSLSIATSYAWRIVLLCLAAGSLALLAIAVPAVLAPTFSSQFADYIAVPAAILVGWLLLRWGLTLPACAIDTKLRFRESWNATRPLAGALLWISLAAFAIGFFLDQALGAFYVSDHINGLLSALAWAFQYLISASVLTTLYGMAIEGREI